MRRKRFSVGRLLVALAACPRPRAAQASSRAPPGPAWPRAECGSAVRLEEGVSFEPGCWPGGMNICLVQAPSPPS